MTSLLNTIHKPLEDGRRDNVDKLAVLFLPQDIYKTKKLTHDYLGVSFFVVKATMKMLYLLIRSRSHLAALWVSATNIHAADITTIPICSLFILFSHCLCH